MGLISLIPFYCNNPAHGRMVIRMRWREPMTAFRHISFPVDFSRGCENSVPYVKEMVRAHNAVLSVIHVVETPMRWYTNMTPDVEFYWDTLEEVYKIGTQKLENFCCEHFNDLAKLTSVEKICTRGDPGYSILAEAESRGVDLIMIPTMGEGPFRSFVTGSTAARVLHRAKCAVWTSAHMEGQPDPVHARIKSIVCAVDLEKESGHIIESAVSLAQTFSAQIRLVHRIAVPEKGPEGCSASDFNRFLADYARDQLEKIQRQTGTHFEVCLEGGSISESVRDAALRYNADLVVIGRGHVQAPFSRLRSNAYAIIREAPCAVISI